MFLSATCIQFRGECVSNLSCNNNMLSPKTVNRTCSHLLITCWWCVFSTYENSFVVPYACLYFRCCCCFQSVLIATSLLVPFLLYSCHFGFYEFFVNRKKNFRVKFFSSFVKKRNVSFSLVMLKTMDEKIRRSFKDVRNCVERMGKRFLFWKIFGAIVQDFECWLTFSVFIREKRDVGSMWRDGWK